MMDNKTKSKAISAVLITFLGLVIIIFGFSIIFRFIVSPPVDPTIDDDIEKISVEEVIQVNILNACGIKGIAAYTQDFLRSKDFDVVDIGNYKKDVETSFIIDRVGDISSAKKVAYALGIEDSLIVTKIDSNLFLRSSVILGSDYKKLNPFD